MNCDDDSFLSGYLDGELGQKERATVESGLVADRELAEKLRSLTAVRDLVSSLNRDVPVDVKGLVMARVCRVGRGKSPADLRQMWLRAASQSPRAALVAGFAATVLIAVTLAVTMPSLLRRTGSAPFNALAEGGTARPSLPSDPAGAAISGDAGKANLAATSKGVAVSGQGDAAREAIVRAFGGASRSGGGLPVSRASGKGGTLEHFRQLLDNPRERRLFRIGDSGDGKVHEQVASVVESTTQFEFYQITIAQGIVIDPRHPEEATVYAALVSAKGLDALRNRLARNVSGPIEESPADAAVVTQLVDIGQVRARPAAPFGDVRIPDGGMFAFQDPNQSRPEQYLSAPIGHQLVKGMRARAAGEHPAAEGLENGGLPPAKRGGGISGLPNAPSRDADRRPLASPAAATRGRELHDDAFIVLVWVEHAHRG
jgi:hypothetical protein